MMACRRMLDITLCVAAFFASAVLSQESNVTWTEIYYAVGEVPARRQLHTAVVTPAGRMWIFGGYESFGAFTYMDDTWYIDLQVSVDSWGQLWPGTKPAARGRHQSVFAPTGKLWIHGGEDNSNSVLSDLWYLQTEDLSSPTWTEVSAGNPQVRKDHSAVLTASGKMFICFGDDGSSRLVSLHYIDLEEQSPWWTMVTPCCNQPPSARISRRAQLSDAGRMWVFGGYGDNRFWNDTWWIDVEDGSPNWNEVATGTAPDARADAATVLTSTGRFWVFGGSLSGSILESDLWYMDVEVRLTQ
ncbi:Adagio-like protein 3 [Symbiodinium microadriaticum]|uniref:Adagio-like protein 3 n=1 Tax=Symbiodinium microadriaticum TaxID=2951 RepID=A0A1Q9F5M0_SYMMI|nr:Adagio-like protein 3 [Symbiodinium microadriaticum]